MWAERVIPGWEYGSALGGGEGLHRAGVMGTGTCEKIGQTAPSRSRLGKKSVRGCGYRAARVSKRLERCAKSHGAAYGGLVLPDTAGVRCGRAQGERRLSEGWGCLSGIVEHGFYCQERVKKSWGHACAHSQVTGLTHPARSFPGFFIILGTRLRSSVGDWFDGPSPECPRIFYDPWLAVSSAPRPG